MIDAVRYLIARFFYRIWEFIVHWYWHGFLWFGKRTVNFFERTDQVIALRITIHYFFEPLYRDYSTLGRMLGVLFRSLRVLFGLVVYAFFGAIAVVLYVVWAAAPLYLLSKIIIP